MMMSQQVSQAMAEEGEPRRLSTVRDATAEEQELTSSTSGQYDGMRPNPDSSGSSRPEDIRVERRGISLRRAINVATWNVQGMTTGKMSVVESEMVNRKTSKTVLGYNPVSERVMSVRLSGNPVNITIVQTYAPTADSDEEEVVSFYECLQGVFDKIPRRDIILIMGDFNAKLGQTNQTTACVGRWGLGERNSRGDLLEEFCLANDLVVTNTTFQQHWRRLYTWISPGDRCHNQIDYIMIGKRGRSCVLSAKTRPSADCGSDHQLLVARIKIRLKSKPKVTAPER
jgi:exonuclease III